jgi:drug/metabolite transporter (DMT)-like permease
MRGIFWVAAGAALWGTDTVLRRPLSAVIPPVQLVFYEHWIVAAVVLPILIRYRHHLRKIALRSWLAVLCISWAGSVLGLVLFTYAVRAGNPTTAVLLQKAQPVFAIALAGAVLGERFPRQFPGIVLAAIAGVYLISFGGGSLLAPWESVDGVAALFALGAALGWGCSTVFGRYLSSQLPFELITALRIVCALPLLTMLMIAGAGGPMAALDRSMILPLAFIALIPGFAALMLYYKGLRSTPASHASIAELAFPATAALLNWVVLGTPAAALQIIGLAVVWYAIFYLRRLPSKT